MFAIITRYVCHHYTLCLPSLRVMFAIITRNVFHHDTLYLTQDAVHHPVDAGCADAVGCADVALLQMFDDALNERQLDVLRVLDLDFLSSLFSTQDDGLVGKDREVKLTSVAHKFDAVCACTLVAYKAPGAAARQAVGKLEGGTHGVFRLIKSASIAAETFRFNNRTEYLLKQVYLVRSEVVEVTAACDVALHTPG